MSAVIISLNSCRNRCLFCCPEGTPGTIDEEELKKIEINILNQVKDIKKRGFRQIEISGNDPVEYEKIPQFIKWLKNDMGFLHVRLATHGRNLKDAGLVKRLKEAGLDTLKIPFYGTCAAIHDSVTQAPGSFDETTAGVENVRSITPETHLMATFLITKQNCDDAVNFPGFAARFADLVIIGIPCMSSIENAGNFSVSFDDMKPSLLTLAKRVFESGRPVFIMDIPFCVFGFYQFNIINKTGPPAVADNYAIPDKFKSGVKDLPSYRIKAKLDICEKCSLEKSCDGFYEKYIEMYDLSRLKPL